MVRFLFMSFTLLLIAVSAYWAAGYMFFIVILVKMISDPTGNLMSIAKLSPSHHSDSTPLLISFFFISK
jgi:hypothetical protein